MLSHFTARTSLKKNILLKLTAATLALTGTLLVSNQVSAEEEPIVYVSVTPQKYLLEQIAGDLVQIEVLVQPGHNPHSYDPSARQMARLSKADLLMTTGVPFEQNWLPRIQRLNPQLTIVDTLQGQDQPQTSKTVAAQQHHEHDSDNHDGHKHDSHKEDKHGHHDGHKHDSHKEDNHGHHDNHGHDHDHDGIDPHVWMDPIQASAQAKVMAAALKKAYPASAGKFEQGYQRISQQLLALDLEIRQQLAPYKGRTFMVFHPAWGHFAERYGLEQIAIEYQGKAPSARQLVSLSEQAKAENIKVILVQEQFNRKPAERIAENIGARVINADPLPDDLPQALRDLTEKLLESWQ